MTIIEIANSVTELLRQGKFDEVYDQHFDVENIKHVEPQSPYFSNLVGLKAIKEKDVQMQANIQSVNGMEVGNPIIAKSHFALPYKLSFTLKNGDAANLDEIIVYEVQNGKIVLEQFFY